MASTYIYTVLGSKTTDVIFFFLLNLNYKLIMCLIDILPMNGLYTEDGHSLEILLTFEFIQLLGLCKGFKVWLPKRKIVMIFETQLLWCFEKPVCAEIVWRGDAFFVNVTDGRQCLMYTEKGFKHLKTFKQSSITFILSLFLFLVRICKSVNWQQLLIWAYQPVCKFMQWFTYVWVDFFVVVECNFIHKFSLSEFVNLTKTG